MKYFSWLWNNSRGIRWNTTVRIVTGIGQVVLGLLMVWFSKRFIDETICACAYGSLVHLNSPLHFCLSKNIEHDFSG